MAGVGRPRGVESRERRAEFLRLVAEGVPGDEAAKRARIKTQRAVKVLAELVRHHLLAEAA